MLTLALLRHAKADKDMGGGDHARPLAPAGRADAASVGVWLRPRLPGPVLVLASDARRTRETAELAFPAPRDGVEIRLEADLYGASAADLLQRIRGLDGATAVLVGHNPGIGEVARRLAGPDGDAAASMRLGESFPTSSCAVLRFDGGWAEVMPGAGLLTALHRRDGGE